MLAHMNTGRLCRFALLLLALLWLVVVVILPLTTLIRRSVTADVSVAVWGRDDIRAGGRRVQLRDGHVFIDDEPAAGRPSGGVSFERSDGGFAKVAFSSVEVEGQRRRVRPIQVRFEGDRTLVDGRPLPEDDWSVEVPRYIGLVLFARYFASPALYASLLNSLFVATSTMALSVTTGFVYAYALTRTRLPGKGFFRVVALTPLFAPTMLHGLALVHIFGNQGLVTTGFFGRVPWLAVDISLYGPVGIILAEWTYTFPSAVIILTVALSTTDARLYEAAASLGASGWRTFRTVTLPGARYGLLSAAFVSFTLAFTDFGAPKVVGGNYSVLAVDIYAHVVGQHDFGMGSVVSLMLLAPALAAFILERVIERRQTAAVTSRSVAYHPPRRPLVDAWFLLCCAGAASALLAVVAAAGLGSLAKMWPYDLALTLAHYKFEGVGGGGYGAYWNSVRMATWTALAGAAVTFVSAYLVEKTRGFRAVRRTTYALSMLPLALPGLVIGIAYIFFFNDPFLRVPFTGWAAPNPLNGLYGTLALLVLANIVHFYTVSFLTATTALRQLDAEFEAVSESLGVSGVHMFFRVTLPVCLPAFIEICAYYFVNSLATVSAMIFLYSTDTRLASVAVVHMDDAGDTAAAAAMCMLIFMTNVGVRLVFEALAWLTGRRAQAWRRR